MSDDVAAVITGVDTKTSAQNGSFPAQASMLSVSQTLGCDLLTTDLSVNGPFAKQPMHAHPYPHAESVSIPAAYPPSLAAACPTVCRSQTLIDSIPKPLFETLSSPRDSKTLQTLPRTNISVQKARDRPHVVSN